MSAEVETMMSVRKIPWHNLGTIVDEHLIAADALTAAGLDWRVEKVPLYANNPQGGRRLEIPDRFGIQRQTDGRVLGVVGSHYVPFQNIEAFQFFDNLVDSGEAKYETAGSLYGGQHVWIMAKIPEGINVGGIDPHTVYLLLMNRHDGTGSITSAVTPIRVVCANTANMAMRAAKREWKVRHVSNVGARVQEARDALDLTFIYMEEFQARADALLAKTMSMRSFSNFLDKLGEDLDFTERTLEGMKDVAVPLFNEGETLENIRGTRWAAFNAVSEWSEWLRSYMRDDAETHARANWNVNGSARRVRKAAMTRLS